MLALLLAQNIAALLVIVLIGVVLVRAGVLKESDGKPISTLIIYVFSPAIIITSLEVDFSWDLAAGMGLAVVAAVAMQLLSIGVGRALARPLGLTEVEKGSVGYSNSANLLIPLIIATLGQEWVIYSLAYVVVGLVFMFTHLETLISGRPRFSLKSIVANPNLLAVAAGLVLFLTGLRLPGPIETAVTSLGGMLGPAAMLVAGIGIGSKSLKDVVVNKRVWLTSALKLIAVPLVACAILKFAAPVWLIPNAREILLCTLLAASAPCASMVVQFAMLYDRDVAYASSINVVSTLCCIATMPVMVALYML